MSLLQLFKNFFTKRNNPSKEKSDFEKLYHDLGMFVYEDDGFIFQFTDGPQKILWSEIEQMTTYKADLMTYDQLRIDIKFRGLFFTINEDTPGFYQFVLKTKEKFLSIRRDWDIKIIQPAFATNDTIIYQRED